MPMQYTSPVVAGSVRRLRFWIRSSQGTDSHEVVEVPADWSEGQIKGELEQWCEQFGAWHASESIVRYGYEPADGTDG